jgi:hypothetical protein
MCKLECRTASKVCRDCVESKRTWANSRHSYLLSQMGYVWKLYRQRSLLQWAITRSDKCFNQISTFLTFSKVRLLLTTALVIPRNAYHSKLNQLTTPGVVSTSELAAILTSLVEICMSCLLTILLPASNTVHCGIPHQSVRV